MKFFEYKTININSISVWKLNPRHEQANNEKEAIEYLFKTVGSSYMNNLAKDICEKGLSPYDLPIIVKIKNTTNKYYAYEGNRRMAVIKSILNPELLSFNQSLHSKYKELNKEYSNNISQKIMCVYTDHDSAIDEIEKIHSGEQNGIGRKKWGSLEKEIFNATFREKTSITLNITNSINDTLSKEIVDIIKPTNINRIFSNKNIKNLLNTKDYSNLSENDIYIIDKIIEKAVEIEKKENKGMSRIFNTQDIISSTFVPFIEELKNSDIGKGFNIRADNVTIKENDKFNLEYLKIMIYDKENKLINFDQKKLKLNYYTPDAKENYTINTSIVGKWRIKLTYENAIINRTVQIIPIIIPKIKLREENVKINVFESYQLLDNIIEAKDSLSKDAKNKLKITSVGEKEANLEKNVFLNTNKEGEYSIKYELSDDNSPSISKVLNILVLNKKTPLTAEKDSKNHILGISNMYNTKINISNIVNTLINQLSKLDIDKFDCVVATSLRALIELTVDEVISKKNINITYLPKQDKLLTRTNQVVLELKSNISYICTKASAKFNYHTVNNFLNTLDINELLDFLNLSAHKSLKITTLAKLTDVANKQIALFLVLVHYYLEV